MRAGIVVNVTPVDRRRLEAIVADRCAPQKHVWRAQIILATADGCGTAEIMRQSGKAKPVVWRWQARFMGEGVDGLLRDKTRKPGKPTLPTATVQKVSLRDGARRHCLEAARLTLPLRPLARLTQDEEPGCSGGEARRERGLGQMTRTHSLPCERWGEKGRPKERAAQGLGGVDKDWVLS